jgi:hypothetical protein
MPTSAQRVARRFLTARQRYDTHIKKLERALKRKDPDAAVTKDVNDIPSPGYPSWPEYFSRGDTKVYIQFKGQNHLLTITHGVVGMEDHRVERAVFGQMRWSHADRFFGDISFNDGELKKMFDYIRRFMDTVGR